MLPARLGAARRAQRLAFACYVRYQAMYPGRPISGCRPPQRETPGTPQTRQPCWGCGATSGRPSNLGLVGPPRYWTGGRLPPWRTRDRIHSSTSSSNQPTAMGPIWTRRGNSPWPSSLQIWTGEYPVRRLTSAFLSSLRSAPRKWGLSCRSTVSPRVCGVVSERNLVTGPTDVYWSKKNTLVTGTGRLRLIPSEQRKVMLVKRWYQRIGTFGNLEAFREGPYFLTVCQGVAAMRAK